MRRLAPLAVLAAALTVHAGPPPGLHDSWGRVLGRYVTADHLVRYAALAAHREDLDGYLGALAALDPGDVASWPEPERMALLLNAYNACTVAVVLDHRPIRPRGLAARRFPTPSLRQIPRIWKEPFCTVAGRRLSLGEIEHGILRRRFHEPRVHLALVCAARGCPPLRREPYLGDRLDAQLEDQARTYLASPAGLRVDPDRGRVELSAVFRWFRDDFAERLPDDPSVRRSRRWERALLGWVARHTTQSTAAFLREGRYRLAWIPYDWTLNAAPGAE